MTAWKVQGLADIERRLKELSSDMATKVGQQADRAGAVVLAKAISAAAPVGPTPEGAPMRRKRKGGSVKEYAHEKISLHVKVKKTRSTSTTQVQTTVTTGAAFQSSFEEFGSIHNAPTRFMTKAVATAQSAAIEAIAAAFQKRLARAGV